MFNTIIVPECERLNVFEVKDEERTRIPIEFKILICLRILDRRAYHDDNAEMATSFKSIVNSVFRLFLRNFTPAFFKALIAPPTGYKRKNLWRHMQSLDCPEPRDPWMLKYNLYMDGFIS